MIANLGPVFNNDGDIVISEEEFMEVQRLKDLKKTYQIDYEELKTLKTQVQYCQKLVDQCRQKLLNGKFFFSTILFLQFSRMQFLSKLFELFFFFNLWPL